MSAANGRCRACMEPVIWARTEVHGLWFPLNPDPDRDPDPAGKQAAFKPPQGPWQTRQLGKDDRPRPYETVHVPHIATCAKQRPKQEPPSLPPNVIPIGQARRNRDSKGGQRHG